MGFRKATQAAVWRIMSRHKIASGAGVGKITGSFSYFSGFSNALRARLRFLYIPRLLRENCYLKPYAGRQYIGIVHHPSQPSAIFIVIHCQVESVLGIPQLSLLQDCHVTNINAFAFGLFSMEAIRSARNIATPPPCH